MTTGWKRAWLVVAVLAAGALSWVVADQVSSHAAYRRLDDVNWMRTATSDDLRLTAEQSLGWWFGDPHHAFQVLQTHGDQSSVPYVRAALAQKPSGDDVTCTWAHGEEALERLSRTENGESEHR